MTSEELYELIQERPFVPLRVHMSNGRSHDIRHPELAIVGGDVMAVGVERPDSDFPRIRLVSVHHINEVERIGSTGAET
jgi:hypothetical protein